MAMRVRDLWDWRGETGRRDYFLWGVLLGVIKYNLDRVVVSMWLGRSWFPFEYLIAPNNLAGDLVGGLPMPLVLTLLILALPFIACGVGLTLNRLRNAGWPMPLASLFFLPYINLIFFLVLCVTPGRDQPREEFRAHLPAWKRLLAGRGKFASALLGISASVLLGLCLSLLGTSILHNYGWGLFVGIPFMMGFFSSLFHSAVNPRSWRQCASVGLFSLFVVGASLFALAVEGVVCLAMAAPIAVLLVLLGATAGWLVTRQQVVAETRLYAFSWIVFPGLLAFEAGVPLPTTLRAISTECVIAAPPSIVWKHVIEFSDLPPPQELIFSAGIAYPVRARLIGEGVGAVRHCEFSTGAFVEPITVWEENQHLAFDVLSQPPPLEEKSFYARIHPPHLDGFFQSRKGEFKLLSLENGDTLLRGTTWYEQKFWPQVYWRLWSDYLVHVIHERVLAQIKAESEQN